MKIILPNIILPIPTLFLQWLPYLRVSSLWSLTPIVPFLEAPAQIVGSGSLLYDFKVMITWRLAPYHHWSLLHQDGDLSHPLPVRPTDAIRLWSVSLELVSTKPLLDYKPLKDKEHVSQHLAHFLANNRYSNTCWMTSGWFLNSVLICLASFFNLLYCQTIYKTSHKK